MAPLYRRFPATHTVSTYADLRALPGIVGQTIGVGGKNGPADGGQKHFVCVAGDVATVGGDDDDTLIASPGDVHWVDMSNGVGGDLLAGSFNYTDLRATVADEGDIANCYGISTAGAGGDGQFICHLGTCPIGDNNGTHLQGPGVWWERAGIRDAGYVDVSWFGAVRDPGNNSTDSTAAIQSAIDYAIYTADRYPVRIPAGLFRTTGPIHLGYGDALRSATLEGAGMAYYGEQQFGGTTIYCDFWEGPGIAIQGGYGSVVRSLTVLGKNAIHIRNNGLAGYFETPPLIDDLIESNWVDPTAPASADGRYSPYAGIAIDPYRGPSPGPGLAYPAVTYPSYDLHGGAQYNRNQSSQVLIEDCMVMGFVAGVVNMPNSDGNGDYTACRRVQFAFNKYCFSVGNTQSRSVSLDDCQFCFFFIGTTNRRHGLQQGKFGGNIRNLDCFFGIHLVEFGAYYASPITFSNCYCESLYGLGNISSIAPDSSYVFENCEFTFALQQDYRGVPANTLGSNHLLSGGSPSAPTNIVFRDTSFTHYPSVVVFDQVPNCDGSFFRHDRVGAQPYEKFAHNLLAGGCVVPNHQPHRGGRLKSAYYDLDTAAIAGAGFTDLWATGGRSTCIPLNAHYVCASEREESEEMLHPHGPKRALDRGNPALIAGCVLVNKTLTLTFAGRSDWQFYQEGGLPGDVLWDSQTGSAFFIRSRVGNVIVAELQNNYKSNGVGGYTQLTSMNMTVGAFYVANSRYYTPGRYLRGDCTAASPVLTNCARDDDFSGHVAEIVVGDYMAIQETRDRWVAPWVTQVTARDATAKTITLAGSTGMRTQVRRRLDYFIRKPPANV